MSENELQQTKEDDTIDALQARLDAARGLLGSIMSNGWVVSDPDADEIEDLLAGD